MKNNTTRWMVLFAICQAINIAPNQIDFLPEPPKQIVTGLAGLASSVFAILGFISPALGDKKKIDEE